MSTCKLSVETISFSKQESGGLFDTIILQIASLYGINVNSTRDLLPALFMRAFTDVTVSCR